MTIAEPNSAALAWRVLASPLAGAALTVWAFSFVRVMLPFDAWLLDVITVFAGAAGLLAGGILGFSSLALPRSAALPSTASVLGEGSETDYATGWSTPAAAPRVF